MFAVFSCKSVFWAMFACENEANKYAKDWHEICPKLNFRVEKIDVSQIVKRI